VPINAYIVSIKKFMAPKIKRTVTYMGNLQQASYSRDLADAGDINNMLQQFKNLSGSLHHSFPVFYVLDYTAQQYLIMTDAMQNVAGYHPREFMESRLEKLIEVYHKDDFKIFNQQVFARNTAFLQETPKDEHQRYIFSYNFRFLRQDKKYAHVLQRNSFITSKETGLPLYSLGMIVDITDVKTDTVMVHTIAKKPLDTTSGYKKLVATNYFYPNEEDSLLTRREKLVLQHLSDGLSSKQVAEKLFSSERTVINHRQNMMRKTNSKNVVELVVFAIRNRLI